MEEKDKIQEILASQDRQLQIDAIKMIEQENVPDKEKTFRVVIKHLISKNKKSYPIDKEKVQKEKKKYTESFRHAIEEEQKEKRSERLRRQSNINKTLKAYGIDKTVIKNDGDELKDFFKKIEEDERNSKSFLMQIYEYIMKVKENIKEEPQEKNVTTHKEFMERMHPSSMQEIQHITKKIDDSKDIEK